MKLFKKKSHKSGYCNISEPISDLDPKRISAIKSRHVSELDPKVISAIKAQHLQAVSSKGQPQWDKHNDGTDVTISLTPSPSQSSKSAQPKIVITTTVGDHHGTNDGSPTTATTTATTASTTTAIPWNATTTTSTTSASAATNTATTTTTTTANTKRLFFAASSQDTPTATAVTTAVATTTNNSANSPKMAMTGSSTVGMVGGNPNNGNAVVATPSPSSSCKPPIVPKTPDTFFQGRNRKRLDHADHQEVDTQMPVHYFENMGYGTTSTVSPNGNDDEDEDGHYDDDGVDMDPMHNPSSSGQGRAHGIEIETHAMPSSSLPQDTTASPPSSPPRKQQTKSQHKRSFFLGQSQKQPQKKQQPKQQLPVHHAMPTNNNGNGTPLLERKDSNCSDMDKTFSPDIISVHSDITDPSFHSHSNRKSSRRSWHWKIRDGFRETCRQHDLKTPMSFLEMILDSICSGPRS